MNQNDETLATNYISMLLQTSEKRKMLRKDLSFYKYKMQIKISATNL